MFNWDEKNVDYQTLVWDECTHDFAIPVVHCIPLLRYHVQYIKQKKVTMHPKKVQTLMKLQQKHVLLRYHFHYPEEWDTHS